MSSFHDKKSSCNIQSGLFQTLFHTKEEDFIVRKKEGKGPNPNELVFVTKTSGLIGKMNANVVFHYNNAEPCLFSD
jgi:hypothetical protein